jgi:hypothetical protein
MQQHERDKLAYRLCFEYLLRFSEDGVTRDILQRYLDYNNAKQRPTSISALYQKLLSSAQEASLKSGVIGRSIGGVSALGKVLYGFDPSVVVATFGTDWEKVLNQIERRLKPNGKIRRTPRSIWPQYCRTILSGAEFFTQFHTSDEFYQWADSFDREPKSRLALPLLISSEIVGIGFALACNFLKDIGYVNFGKPDVHIRDLFKGLNLCGAEANDVQILRALIRISENVGVTPYNVDKLFWLVGSGYFHDDMQIGKQGRVRTDKRAFIASARKQLK